MPKKKLTGAQAIAYGAFYGGVGLASSYPGSPATSVMDAVIELAPQGGFYVEWSTNEKVALEMGIGASMAGRRALVCVKGVGMNVLIDPLMTLNLTDLNGGMIILVGDDPGAYGSQNDQDSRPVAHLIELPMWEPARPSKAFEMTIKAFELSEQVQLPIILRITRAFSTAEEEVSLPSIRKQPKFKGLQRAPFRYAPCPINAVSKHAALHGKLSDIAEVVEQHPYNRIFGDGSLGVIACGFCFAKLWQIIGGKPDADLAIFKLSALYPLPQGKIIDFLDSCEAVVILEENAPFVETGIRAIAQAIGSDVEIFGKQTGHVPREGELYRWQIQTTLEQLLPNRTFEGRFTKEEEKQEHPVKKNNCEGCNYDKVLDALEEASKQVGQSPVLLGDPGCLVSVADRIDGKYAMGSAVSVADGISKTGVEERAVALFGDSSFFHLTLPAICNAVHNGSDILMVLLDNQSAVTSGYQPNPGSGKNAIGQEKHVLNMGKIAEACGVSRVSELHAEGFGDALAKTFVDALTRKELELIIIRL